MSEKCSVCGANVTIEGHTTHYYVNLDHQEITALKNTILEKDRVIGEARREIEYYGDVDNWWWGYGEEKDRMDKIENADVELFGTEVIGGKRAREFLARTEGK